MQQEFTGNYRVLRNLPLLFIRKPRKIRILPTEVGRGFSAVSAPSNLL
jgi:hypothetical protein